MLILAILYCTSHTGLLDQSQREVAVLIMCNIYMVFQTFNRLRASTTMLQCQKYGETHSRMLWFLESLTISGIIKEADVPLSFKFILIACIEKY